MLWQCRYSHYSPIHGIHSAGAQILYPNLFARCRILDARRRQQPNACDSATSAHSIFRLLVHGFTAQFERAPPSPLVGVLLNQPMSRPNKGLPCQNVSQNFTPLPVATSRHRPFSKLSLRCANPRVFALRDLRAKHLFSRWFKSQKACRGEAVGC